MGVVRNGKMGRGAGSVRQFSGQERISQLSCEALADLRRLTLVRLVHGIFIDPQINGTRRPLPSLSRRSHRSSQVLCDSCVIEPEAQALLEATCVSRSLLVVPTPGLVMSAAGEAALGTPNVSRHGPLASTTLA